MQYSKRKKRKSAVTHLQSSVLHLNKPTENKVVLNEARMSVRVIFEMEHQLETTDLEGRPRTRGSVAP